MGEHKSGPGLAPPPVSDAFTDTKPGTGRPPVLVPLLILVAAVAGIATSTPRPAPVESADWGIPEVVATLAETTRGDGPIRLVVAPWRIRFNMEFLLLEAVRRNLVLDRIHLDDESAAAGFPELARAEFVLTSTRGREHDAELDWQRRLRCRLESLGASSGFLPRRRFSMPDGSLVVLWQSHIPPAPRGEEDL